jgi:hypothetical protein
MTDTAIDAAPAWMPPPASVPAEVKRQAREAGFSWTTIRRAKDVLGIRSSKARFDGGWEWALPKMLTCTEDAQPAGLSTLGQVEHLGRKSDGMNETSDVSPIDQGPFNKHGP